ncbi:MAG: MBL fold metallo-hydrolase [Planctomycetota bacterium]|nr:MBL fold metallo-hydrolase [Planctomycetota bacterium]
MVTFSIQSGSNGNCIYVEAGDTRLLFDAGVSGKRAKERMAEHGRCPSDADALFVSHEHGDHIRSAGVFHRMFDLPVYVTKPTINANAWNVGQLDDVRHFGAGESICIDGVTVHTIPTPHDAVDTVSFIVEHDGRRLGIFTDLGHPFALLAELLGSVDAAYLESNYDVGMLDEGVVSTYSHDPRCLLGSNGIRRTQLTSELFDFLDRAGRDGLDLDDD